MYESECDDDDVKPVKRSASIKKSTYIDDSDESVQSIHSDEDEHVDYDDYDFPTYETEVFQDSRNSGNEGVPQQIETNNPIVSVPTDELVVYDHGNDDDLPILELTDESEDF